MYVSFDGLTDTVILKLSADALETLSMKEVKKDFFIYKGKDEEIIAVVIKNFWEVYCTNLLGWREIKQEMDWYKTINFPKEFVRYVIEITSSMLQIKKADALGVDI